MTQTTNTPYVTLEEMAEYLRISKQTLMSWLRQKRIPANTYLKFGRAYRFDRDAVVAAMRGYQMELFPTNNEDDGE